MGSNFGSIPEFPHQLHLYRKLYGEGILLTVNKFYGVCDVTDSQHADVVIMSHPSHYESRRVNCRGTFKRRYDDDDDKISN